MAHTLGLSESDAIEWDVRQSLTQKIIDSVSAKRFDRNKFGENFGNFKGKNYKDFKGRYMGYLS